MDPNNGCEGGANSAWRRPGPQPVHDTMLRVLCAGSKELARSIKAGNRWQTVYEAIEPYSQTKRLRPHCVMPQSSEGHFLETITWPQNDEASRVQSQPLTVHVWLNTLLSARPHHCKTHSFNSIYNFHNIQFLWQPPGSRVLPAELQLQRYIKWVKHN
jgi:hypothetical protein